MKRIVAIAQYGQSALENLNSKTVLLCVGGNPYARSDDMLYGKVPNNPPRNTDDIANRIIAKNKEP